MKTIILLITSIASFQPGFSQLGDAYHAPNALQLSLEQQRRITAADNAHYDNMRSGNRASSSTGNISGDYNAYGWADYSRIKKQEAAGRRQDARIKEYNDKVNKLEALIKSRKLKREPAYQSQLAQCARDAGFDDFEVSHRFGYSEASYKLILEEAGKNNNGGISGSTKTSCQGDCTETLNYNNGDVYIGNTLNGNPHGKGKLKTKAANYEIEGNFSNGQFDGEVTIKGQGYTETGRFNKGKQIGIHTITTQEKDGITGNYKMNFDNLENCTYSATDGMEFTGTMDEKYYFVKGEIVYGNGTSFKGYFKNNNPYRGVWHKEHRTMVGEFGSNEKTDNLYLKYGYLENTNTKTETQGYYSPDMQRVVFQNLTSQDGTVTETTFSAPDVEEYVCVYFKSGNRLYMKANADGNDYIGVQYLVSDPGHPYPIRYSKQDGIVNLKPTETVLITKSSQYANEAKAKTKEWQLKYSNDLKNVDEFFNPEAQTKEANKKTETPKTSANSVTVAIDKMQEKQGRQSVNTKANTSNADTKESDKAPEKSEQVANSSSSTENKVKASPYHPDEKANNESVKDASTFQKKIDKLNAYLKTFDDGYYGYFEVSDSRLFIRLRSGNSYSAEINNLDNAYVVEENKKIEIKCLEGKNCMTIAQNSSLTDRMVLYQSAAFNTAEFCQLINDFIYAYKHK